MKEILIFFKQKKFANHAKKMLTLVNNLSIIRLILKSGDQLFECLNN